MNILNFSAVLAAIFVNGATDAPGNIAGALSSGSISFRRACVISAVFNFIGMFATATLFPAVAESTAELVPAGEAAVSASLCAVVIFSAAAWFFGIPTSESHGLIAALGGAAIYYGGAPEEGFVGIIVKSALSCLCGFAAGLGISAAASDLFGRMKKRTAAWVQGSTAAAESLCHGIQDGQKFLALLWVRGTLSRGTVFALSAVMALGCLFGGRRISEKLADTVGRGQRGEAVSADAAGIATTLASSALGIPISTTYMKSCAMIGASLGGGRPPNVKSTMSFIVTWSATYPVCMATAYVLCHVFERFFF